jgi:hypothetical protein
MRHCIGNNHCRASIDAQEYKSNLLERRQKLFGMTGKPSGVTAKPLGVTAKGFETTPKTLETTGKPLGTTPKPLEMTAKGFGNGSSPSVHEKNSEFGRTTHEGDPTKPSGDPVDASVGTVELRGWSAEPSINLAEPSPRSTKEASVSAGCYRR